MLRNALIYICLSLDNSLAVFCKMHNRNIKPIVEEITQFHSHTENWTCFSCAVRFYLARDYHSRDQRNVNGGCLEKIKWLLIPFAYQCLTTRNTFVYYCMCHPIVDWWRHMALNILHFETKTKWPSFRKRHFQMHFPEWKCMDFY